MTTPIPGTVAAEPVAFTELVRAVLVVLVTLGWVTIDSNVVNVIASGVGLAISWGLTLFARSRVTPVMKEEVP
jgi:hypothetical protein